MFCRHPRFSTLPRDLFEGLESFRELESRIAALSEELKRGDALEVFVESYLQTHALFQVKDLWLVGQVPDEVRKALNLPRDHKGIDGVFQTRSGTLVPYQVKFRIARPQVSVREVATFLGLTERAKDRMLISNSDRYAGDVENRDRLRILTGTYFDSLTRDELAAIAAWLKARPVRPTPAVPRPHQQAAIDDITAVLAMEDRATAVMACGTGKTLVGLRVAEAMAAQTVLVLVPSLALLSQALADWSRDTVLGDRFEYLCVCSDPSVTQAVDDWNLRTTETPFPVEIEPNVVRKFLKRPARQNVRVVFCTYHSAPVLAKGVPRGLAFDLAIFDEAHKTAGPASGTFAFALEDRQLRIHKRLFLTATPKKVDVRHKDRQGEFRFISMDDPTVYGKRVHDLTFPVAVARKIICDYQVLVATIDQAEISAFAIKHGITVVKGDAQATRWVASQIAVAKAIKETGAKKVITFHSRVEQAKYFASHTPRGISHLLPDFKVGHVNGSDPVSVRKEVLAGFTRDQKVLVTNARCLTEGVDLPAVDMVVFNSPRKSKVDIIQAIGRAMRKPHTQKAFGYVVVPVMLGHAKSGDIETACCMTEWEDVVDVLAALRDHDCRLDELLREQQVLVGGGRAFNPRVFRDHLRIIGPLVSVSKLERHITVQIIERLAETWDRSYGSLCRFRDEHGHTNVPRGFHADPQLAVWLGTQRQNKRRNRLRPDRLDRLDAIGVVWDPRDALWAERLLELEAFKSAHGHCNVPHNYPQMPGLGAWLTRQRRAKSRNQLPADRLRQLELVGVTWDALQHQWDQKIAALATFKARHGHCNVPQRYPDDPSLAAWLPNQRLAKRRGTLSADRVRQLELMGVDWEPDETVWREQLEALRRFKQSEGHCEVPKHYDADPRLGIWLTNQRARKKSKRLSKDKIRLLEALGVKWDAIEDQWEKRYGELKQYRDKNGHSDVPTNYPPNQRLAVWLFRQRQMYAADKLPKHRIAKLAALGVAWDPHEKAWQESYAELVAFRELNGHCGVPFGSATYRRLWVWLGTQRQKKRKKLLAEGRVRKLEALGVIWHPQEAEWQRQFAALASFKRRNGHCNVARNDRTNASLATWVNNQRGKYVRKELSRSRIRQLKALGFNWRVR